MKRFNANANFIGYVIDVGSIRKVRILVGISYQQQISRSRSNLTDYADGIRNLRFGRMQRAQYKASAIF